MKKIAILLGALLILTAFFSVSLADEAEAKTVLKTDVVELRDEWQAADEPCTSQVIIFEMLDDTNATLTDRLIQSEAMHNDTVYTGTYKLTDLGYEFLSKMPFSENEWYYAVVVPDTETPGRIKGITYEYLDYSMKDLAGTYKGTSDAFGEATLELTEAGYATLTAADGSILTGSLVRYNNGYDFFANIGGDMYEDYYVELSGDTFTIVTFQSAVYGGHAGTYTAEGDLGTLVFTVSDDGAAATDLTLDEKQFHLVGSISVDEEAKQISSLWLSCDEGIDLNLELQKLDDGTLNYYGSYSVTLSAG